MLCDDLWLKPSLVQPPYMAPVLLCRNWAGDFAMHSLSKRNNIGFHHEKHIPSGYLPSRYDGQIRSSLHSVTVHRSIPQICLIFTQSVTKVLSTRDDTAANNTQHQWEIQNCPQSPTQPLTIVHESWKECLVYLNTINQTITVIRVPLWQFAILASNPNYLRCKKRHNRVPWTELFKAQYTESRGYLWFIFMYECFKFERPAVVRISTCSAVLSR